MTDWRSELERGLRIYYELANILLGDDEARKLFMDVVPKRGRGERGSDRKPRTNASDTPEAERKRLERARAGRTISLLSDCNKLLTSMVVEDFGLGEYIADRINNPDK